MESSWLVWEKDQPVPPLTVCFGTRVLAFVAGSLVVFRKRRVGRWFCVMTNYLAIPSAKASE